MQQEIDLPAQPVAAQDWISRLEIGEAGVRHGLAIKFRAGLLGCVAHGSLGHLKPGRYRLTLEIRSRTNGPDGYEARILVEVTMCSRAICVHVLTRSDFRNPRH